MTPLETKAYLVVVASSGYTTDWSDSVIVVAKSPEEAVFVADNHLRGMYPLREIKEVEGVYELGGSVRVVGRLQYED